MNKTDSLITLIAQQHLRIETLETRNSDSLDFHDVSVGGIKFALNAALIAGQQTAREEIAEMLGAYHIQNAELLRIRTAISAMHDQTTGE
jgi:hypothetical protein